ncbi:FRG domain-containing protein [Clostridium sp. BNL1100]|uniref:FRG domain-containing protein n=1 Tax=Clostridium sp. BNL1100 TaxID=755731 RepID=UPI00024A76D1|nr:FRG domain-containing protein [Clostridium sp. BNL1100]AEY65612.1 FRG domain protein [Clostridium sp. BNL1100]
MKRSWNDFLNTIENEINSLDKKGCDIPFFRGHNDGIWELKPSLFRKGTNVNESNIYFDFVTYSAPLLENKIMTGWDYLFEMRHCGLPTRLLDWTENFAVALYFAIKGNPKNPCIWILDPFEMNHQSCGNSEIYNPAIDFEFTYEGAFVKEQETSFTNPIAIIPIKQSKRLFAQKGVFTLHFENRKSINEIFDNCVKQIFIPKDAIKEAKSFLKLSGINEYTIFPDFDGLSRYILENK